MIDKTMCEVLWRNISDFYVNLRVEVAAVSRNRCGVKKTVDTHENIDKCNKMLCLSPRNMLDKTIFEILIDSLNQSEILYLFAYLLFY